MPQFKQIDITNIYWASNDGFKGGRDPMGIQNSSVATYSKLLPGLTNLTGHIRYYSIYCWLLDEYDQLDKKGEVTLHQYNFIRRSELAMALLMKNAGVRSVVGALFVAQGNYKFVEEGVYNLADGADYESEKKYWSFTSGAFGQYYLGSLIFYGLVKLEEGRFYLGQKGKEIAATFRNSVGEGVRGLFIQYLLEGNMAVSEIGELSSLALNNIVTNSEEWNALNHLLTMKDSDGSNLRRQSVLLMLHDIDKGVSIDDFTRHRFLHVDDEKDIDAAFGWYFYYLCEALHYRSQTSRSLNRFVSLIENEGFNGMDVANILSDIMRDMVSESDESISQKVSVSPVSMPAKKDALPIIKYNAEYDNGDPHNSRLFFIDRTSRLIDCIEESIKKKIRSIDDAINDEEEEGSTETSNERDVQELQEITVSKRNHKMYSAMATSVLDMIGALIMTDLMLWKNSPLSVRL